MEERAGRLYCLKNFHHQAERRQNEDNNRQADEYVHGSFQDAVSWILKRLIHKANEPLIVQAVRRDVVPENFWKVVEHKQSNSGLARSGNDSIERVAIKGKFEEDYLSNPLVPYDAFEHALTRDTRYVQDPALLGITLGGANLAIQIQTLAFQSASC